MINLTVLILAKNEEKNMKECLETVSFAEEVIVIDDFSTDKTKEIAENMGAKVIQRSMNGDWGAQQTFAIQQAKHEWVFFLDADERVTAPLVEAIRKIVDTNEKYAYWIKRHNQFRHYKATHGSFRPDDVCRLIPKKDTSVVGFVHPAFVYPYEDRYIKEYILHHTYDNWEQYMNKVNKYTTLAAEKYKQEGKSVSFTKDVVLRPIWAFFKIYFLNLGFLDGKLGFVFSLNHYNYTLMKYTKLYYLYKSDGKL
ncbi:glycosyltransferase family 2 protein [uncultured Phascolarctobacterium sp.]|uniref:glycosyltransferase family 2 protein n=1 Tax=Phascolarctobacterium sp. TaxID=2049039 RepID=UPI0025F799ED|nr:glycosyltransferase family 2 protein [uncultured Phascolarctobacterium sp.]